MSAANRASARAEAAADRSDTAQGEPLRAQWRPSVNPSDVRSRETAGNAAQQGGRKPRTKFGRLVATYGWRVYALPALLALTVLVAVNTVTASGKPDEKTDAASSGSAGTGKPLATEHRLSSDPPAKDTARLPAGGDFTKAGEGTWHVVPGTSEVVGTGQPVLTYTVEVENGIDPSSYAGNKAFARTVEAILSDPKGWTGSGEVSFKRVDGANADPDFRVSLTTPKTNHKSGVCGYSIEYESSCYNTNSHRVVINLARWVRGAMAFNGDLGLYRQYAINHEVGHALGNSHVGCPKDDALAPVMMQQTFGVSNDYVAKLNKSTDTVPANGNVCRPNAWPNPTARPAD